MNRARRVSLGVIIIVNDVVLTSMNVEISRDTRFTRHQRNGHHLNVQQVRKRRNNSHDQHS